jgi:hypothetical protein
MKQETLEEAAENAWYNTSSMSSEHKVGFEEGFIAGAKWQQERSYSEEDVLRLLVKRELFLELYDMSNEYEDANEWFKKFKNK